MPGWSTKWTFFLVVAFLIFVVARNDLPRWKKIFATSQGSGAPSGTGTTNTPTPPGNTTLQTTNPLGGLGTAPLGGSL